MELPGNIVYLWKKKHYNGNTFRFSSGKRHQNDEVAATLVCGCSNVDGNTSL